MKLLFLIFTASLLTLCGRAYALMPPMSDAELKEAADQIVSAEVLKVECSGNNRFTNCTDMIGYMATLDVDKVIKGKMYKTLYLYFKDYQFKDGCVGSPDTIHKRGEEAVYYLECSGIRCSLVNWNGIKYKKKGMDKLPDCRWSFIIDKIAGNKNQ